MSDASPADMSTCMSSFVPLHVTQLQDNVSSYHTQHNYISWCVLTSGRLGWYSYIVIPIYAHTHSTAVRFGTQLSMPPLWVRVRIAYHVSYSVYRVEHVRVICGCSCIYRVYVCGPQRTHTHSNHTATTYTSTHAATTHAATTRVHTAITHGRSRHSRARRTHTRSDHAATTRTQRPHTRSESHQSHPSPALPSAKWPP